MIATMRMATRFLAVLLSLSQAATLPLNERLPLRSPSTSVVSVGPLFLANALVAPLLGAHRMMYFNPARREESRMALSCFRSAEHVEKSRKFQFTRKGSFRQEPVPAVVLRHAIDVIAARAVVPDDLSTYFSVLRDLLSHLAAQGRILFRAGMEEGFRAERSAEGRYYILVTRRLRKKVEPLAGMLQSGANSVGASSLLSGLVIYLAAKLAHEAAEIAMDSHPSVRWEEGYLDFMKGTTEWVAYDFELEILKNLREPMRFMDRLAGVRRNERLLQLYREVLSKPASSDSSEAIRRFLRDRDLAVLGEAERLSLLDHLARQDYVPLRVLENGPRERLARAVGRSSEHLSRSVDRVPSVEHLPEHEKPVRQKETDDEWLTRDAALQVSKLAIAFQARNDADGPIALEEYRDRLRDLCASLRLPEWNDPQDISEDFLRRLSRSIDGVRVELSKAQQVNDQDSVIRFQRAGLIGVDLYLSALTAYLVRLTDRKPSTLQAGLATLSRTLQVRQAMLWSQRIRRYRETLPEHSSANAALRAWELEAWDIVELIGGGIIIPQRRYVARNVGVHRMVQAEVRPVHYDSTDTAVRSQLHTLESNVRAIMEIADYLHTLGSVERRLESWKKVKPEADERTALRRSVLEIKAWSGRGRTTEKKNAFVALDQLLQAEKVQDYSAAVVLCARARQELSRRLAEIPRISRHVQARRRDTIAFSKRQTAWKIALAARLTDIPAGLPEQRAWFVQLAEFLSSKELPFRKVPPEVVEARKHLKGTRALLLLSASEPLWRRFNAGAQVLDQVRIRLERERLGWAAYLLQLASEILRDGVGRLPSQLRGWAALLSQKERRAKSQIADSLREAAMHMEKTEGLRSLARVQWLAARALVKPVWRGADSRHLAYVMSTLGEYRDALVRSLREPPMDEHEAALAQLYPSATGPLPLSKIIRGLERIVPAPDSLDLPGAVLRELNAMREILLPLVVDQRLEARSNLIHAAA